MSDWRGLGLSFFYCQRWRDKAQPMQNSTIELIRKKYAEGESLWAIANYFHMRVGEVCKILEIDCRENNSGIDL